MCRKHMENVFIDVAPFKMCDALKGNLNVNALLLMKNEISNN